MNTWLEATFFLSNTTQWLKGGTLPCQMTIIVAPKAMFFTKFVWKNLPYHGSSNKPWTTNHQLPPDKPSIKNILGHARSIQGATTSTSRGGRIYAPIWPIPLESGKEWRSLLIFPYLERLTFKVGSRGFHLSNRLDQAELLFIFYILDISWVWSPIYIEMAVDGP